MWIWRADRQTEAVEQDRPRHVTHWGRRYCTVFASALFLHFFGTMTYAQGLGSPAGAFATDPNDPIEIEADQLDVQQDSETATFMGNVVATQGAVKLRANRLKVTYAQSAPKSAPGAAPADNGTQITRIDAAGDVHVTARNGQSADGEWAIYEVGSRQITMGDKVLLRQTGNVIRGAKLRIDLNTGRSRVDGAPTVSGGEKGGDGRVRGLFLPSSP